ncbi:Asp23/Gls24 family envelope stress response protein [Lacticaseibacillus thailandensis]|nr:Asp23/Gls24 family envelope stress response protein [Lacticaseibacillus thailandensis]
MQTTTNDLMANSRLTFDDQVITKITTLCAHEIDGILGMDGNVIDAITDTLSKGDNTSKGIKVDVGEQQVAIDIDVLLEYNRDAHALFEQLCTRVSSRIKQMTGLQVVALNMNVKDVLTKREWQQR